MKSLFGSRTFWVALLTLVVVLVGAAVPGFALDVEHAGGLAVITAGYLIAYSLNPTGAGLVGMLTSRKFWTAALGFLVVILDAFHVFPAPLDVASLAGMITLLIAYMVTLAIDPGGGWRRLLISRKFWATLVGIVVIFLNAFQIALPAGLTSEQIVGIVVVIGGYVAGIGIEGPPKPLPDPVLTDPDALPPGLPSESRGE